MTDLGRALFLWIATCFVVWLLASGMIALVWP